MMTETVTLKYTKSNVSVDNYDTGLSLWNGIDEVYRDSNLREKVVVKMDIMDTLCKYFEKDTIKEYREVLLAVAEGRVTDPELLSKVITSLVEDDEIFPEKLNILFQSCPEDSSFGSYIIYSLASTIKSVENFYRTYFRGRAEVVVCLSHGYLYFSVPDENRDCLLPEEKECEVLSYAKSWKGTFKYEES